MPSNLHMATPLTALLAGAATHAILDFHHSRNRTPFFDILNFDNVAQYAVFLRNRMSRTD